MPDPPWKLKTGLDAVLSSWNERSAIAGCMTASHRLEAEQGQYAPLPADLHPGLKHALAQRGILRLYTHQAKAIEAAQSGRHVVIATPTASGKSLCFHLPVLSKMAEDPSATAIYLYPTKALSRDQEHGVRSLITDAELGIAATVYDGDTPPDARRAARERARIVLTNPDMLHSGILPQHARWAMTMQNLRYVIVDELHTYRGVFGSHVAQVLRRLRRIARFHGADPVFIGATATIGNPAEHASRLIGVGREAISLVDQATAPRGERQLLVYNPPVINAELGMRASYIKSAVRLASDLLEARVRTIIFGRSRNTVEIMLKYLRDHFAKKPAIRDSIVAYRGGYLPDARRRIERGLREGEVLGVVATSALELGIDIGDLDAAICTGYPGSLADTWQRFGRAGRRGDRSAAILVTSSGALDQFLATHPDRLLSGNIEHARIDPLNTEVLVQHLKCAAFELPFTSNDAFGDLSAGETGEALDYLKGHDLVHESGGHYHWMSESFPANHVSLRKIGWDNFVIIDVDNDEVLAELDWHSTPSMLHEQAIYQHDGRQYQVERLDYENHKAYVRLVKPDYFTTAMRHTRVSVIDPEQTGPLREAQIGWGEVSVIEKVVGYKKIKFHTHENSGYGDVRLPEIQMHTTSFWLTVPARICEKMGRARALEGLRGITQALQLVATLALMSDPRDIRSSVGDHPPRDHEDAAEPFFDATAYLYDSVPGGVGLAERIHEQAEPLLQQAAQLIACCDCPFGCPCCVGATALSAEAPPTPKNSPPAPRPENRKRASLELMVRWGMAASWLREGAEQPPSDPARAPILI